jgi:hypothetical protein
LVLVGLVLAHRLLALPLFLGGLWIACTGLRDARARTLLERAPRGAPDRTATEAVPRRPARERPARRDDPARCDRGRENRTKIELFVEGAAQLDRHALQRLLAA